MTFIPRNGIDRCDCGCKYWDDLNECHSCQTLCRLRPCEQRCGEPAEVYGGGRGAGDWAGYYCRNCVTALGYIVFDENIV